MSLRWYSVVIDCHDIGAQARWWAATRADVGQKSAEATWVVLADPEGNEFCVLSARAQ